MSDLPWWTYPMRVLQPIYRFSEGGVNLERLVGEAQEMGFNVILQNVGGMAAWYPSRIPFHRSAQGIEGDPLQKMIACAHAKGMRVLARFDFSGLEREAYDAHPDWFYQDADARPMVDKGLYATCLSGSFVEEFFKPLYEEVLNRYEIDGVFFNMFGYRDTDRQGVYHGPCRCPACLEKFKAFAGYELPKDTNLAIMRFREARFEQVARYAYRRLKQKDERLAFLDGRGYKATHALAEGYGDVAEMELHWMEPNPRSTDGAPRYAWRYMPGEACRQVRTLGDNFATMVNVFQCGGGRLVGHSEGWNLMAVQQAMANGGWPYLAFTGDAFLYSRRSKKRLVELMRWMEREEAYFTELIAMPEVALITSYENLQPNESPILPDEFRKSFRGWYQVIVERHLEFDVLDVQQLSCPNEDEILGRYPLVILPGAMILDGQARGALERYVKAGGNLIACGEAGFYRPNGLMWEHPAMDCLALDRVRACRQVRNAFFKTDGCRVLPALDDVDLISLNGNMVYADYKNEAKCWLPMEAEIEYASPEQEEFLGLTGQYGLAMLAYGMGKTAYIPWEPARLYHTFGQEDHARLLGDLITFMLPSGPVLSTDAPPQVEITLHRQATTGRIIIQLVNQSGHDGVAFHAPIPVGPIHIALRMVNAKRAAAHRNGQELKVDNGVSGACITLESLADYELIVIDTADRS